MAENVMSAATELETDVRESDEGSPPPKRRKISPGPIPHSPASLRAAPPPSSLSQRFLRLEEEMCQELSLLQFGSPVTHVYQPLSYAAEPHRCYVQSYCHTRKRVLFFGMNPGPFGMAQTGVPFCDAATATGWLRVTGYVTKPPTEHPKRPIHGLASTRREVSGTRFWGLFQDLCTSPETFFENCFVHNYCPLCFMGATGKNVTPPQLKIDERRALHEICDRYLLAVVRLLRVEWVVAVGKYAEVRAKKALHWREKDKEEEGGKKEKREEEKEEEKKEEKEEEEEEKKGGAGGVRVTSITHPSPINPAANKDWKGLVTAQLERLGVLTIIRGGGGGGGGSERTRGGGGGERDRGGGGGRGGVSGRTAGDNSGDS